MRLATILISCAPLFAQTDARTERSALSSEAQTSVIRLFSKVHQGTRTRSSIEQFASSVDLPDLGCGAGSASVELPVRRLAYSAGPRGVTR